jgi:putative membrane protein
MKKLLLLFTKGAAMGAADVVPGVSGGTVAFITGIYDELLKTIASLPRAGIAAVKGRWKEAWRLANGWFLPVLLGGIAFSVVSLARLVSYLLEAHPIPIWSFIFGLVLVSCYVVAREVPQWRFGPVAGLLFGVAFGWWITVASPIQWGTDPVSLFAAGAIAISAMILPGLSGSFILVLLGIYPFVLSAVHSFDLPVLAVFASGCAFGLLSFSHVLRWLLARWRTPTLTILTGIMLGSLNKVWPWSLEESADTDTLAQVANVSPWHFEEHSGTDPQLLVALLAALLGVTIVLGIERIAHHLSARAAD